MAKAAEEFPIDNEEVNRLAAALEPLVMDTSLLDAFCAAFGGPSGKRFNRAFASRVCFLEWLVLYTCVGKSADKWRAVGFAFFKMLAEYGGSYVEWTVEEFFADVDERSLFLAQLTAEGARPDKTTFHDCLLGATALRSQAYFEVWTMTKDLPRTIPLIGQAIHRQITGADLPDESQLTRVVPCLVEEWAKVKALGL